MPFAARHPIDRRIRSCGNYDAIGAIHTSGVRDTGDSLGVGVGQRVAGDDTRREADPSAFVPVCVPADVDLERSLLCVARCEHGDPAGETLVIWPGQVIERDHPLVRMNPGAFAAVPNADLD